MSKLIAYIENGLVNVIKPVTPNLSVAQLNKLAATDVPAGLAYEITDRPSFLDDRTFRSAWQVVDGSIEVDIVQAREIQKDIIRIARAPLMTELDYMQNSGLDVSAERQRLQDFTDLVEGISDLEELKALIPVLEI